MTLTDFRRRVSRCPARTDEPPRAWRCQLRAGHRGDHRSYGGHQRWHDGEVIDHLTHHTTDLWQAEQAHIREAGRGEEHASLRSR